jgi:hypothetical protein
MRWSALTHSVNQRPLQVLRDRAETAAVDLNPCHNRIGGWVTLRRNAHQCEYRREPGFDVRIVLCGRERRPGEAEIYSERW